MKAKLWEVLRRRIKDPGSKFSVCAWCRKVYTSDMILRDELTPEQYAEIESHGICGRCKSEQLELARSRKNRGLYHGRSKSKR